MALFNPSVISVSAAVQQIAAAAGASADPEQTARASVSLFAAFKHFNNRANWDFLETEAAPITVFAPFGFGLVSASAGEVTALVSAGHGVLVDDSLAGGLFNAGTRVTATATTSIAFNYALNSSLGSGVITGQSATATRDMYSLPADWKAEYSVRLLGAQKVLLPIRQRQYGRSVGNEMIASYPDRYDVFPIGGKGKIRLLRAPAQSDILQLRYYRRMTVPTTSATADALDIHQDYDEYLLAWAKWHYLTDKTNTQSEQANTWLKLAENGLDMMLADQTRRPDEDLMFFPGGQTYGDWGVNSTRGIVWDW